MQMGWLLVVRWLVGGFVGCKDLITELKEVATHVFDSPTRQKEREPVSHVLNDITDFWDLYVECKWFPDP